MFKGPCILGVARTQPWKGWRHPYHHCAVVILFWFQRGEFLWQIMNEREASVVPFYVFLASGQEVEGWPCSNAAKRHSGHPKAQIL